MNGRLLGSSPTLEGIGEVIAAFYGGEQKALLKQGDVWIVLRATGARIEGVHVRVHKGRFRFEAIG